MRRLPIFLLFSPSLLFAQTPTTAQTSTATQTATSIVAQAIAAFSPTPITQVELSGTAKAYAGSSQPSGTFTATLKSTGESTLQLNLSDLSRTETTGAAASPPQCQWTGADGVQHAVAQHNCLLPLDWMVPVLTLQTQAASLSQSVSATTDQGVAVEALSLGKPPVNGPAPTQKIAQLSSVELALDATTMWPTSLSFNSHPDSDANTDVPIIARYSDYRQISGASIPFHIQRYLNNGLVLDLTVETVGVQ